MQVYAQLFEKEIAINTLTHNLTAKQPQIPIKIDIKMHSTAKSKQKQLIKAFSKTVLPSAT